jgi:hypothetical protein
MLQQGRGWFRRWVGPCIRLPITVSLLSRSSYATTWANFSGYKPFHGTGGEEVLHRMPGSHQRAGSICRRHAARRHWAE